MHLKTSVYYQMMSTMCSLSYSLWLPNQSLVSSPHIYHCFIFYNLIFTDIHRRPFCSYLLKQQYHSQCPVVADLTCVPRILPSSMKLPMPIPASFIFFFLDYLCPISQVWVHWAKMPFQWQILQILIIITTLWLLSIFLSLLLWFK